MVIDKNYTFANKLRIAKDDLERMIIYGGSYVMKASVAAAFVASILISPGAATPLLVIWDRILGFESMLFRIHANNR